jgi:hypothetical protein
VNIYILFDYGFDSSVLSLKEHLSPKTVTQVAEEIRRKPGLRNKNEKLVVFLEISPNIKSAI